MMISPAIQPGFTAAPARAAQESDSKELEVRPEQQSTLDQYNASRTFGNYVSGVTLGALRETVTTTVQAPRLAYEMVENVWQAETIGPNLKVLGTLAAIPAAVLSIPVSPFYGAVNGFRLVWKAMDTDENAPRELVKDSSPGLAAGLFPREDGPATMTGHIVASLEELGDAKLGEGEEPYDVPILSPLFSVTGGVVSGAISGVVGLLAGTVAGALTTGKEMVRAFTEPDQSMGQRVGRFLAAPLNLLVMGPALAWGGLKESVPRGFVDGWRHGPIKPVIDTCKASVATAGAVIKEAWER